MAKRNKLSLVQLAARLYGCPVEELLSYREYEDGSVVIIAPSGQKFTYPAESIMQFVLREESPQATLKLHSYAAVAAPRDKGGAEAGLPLFGNGGMVRAEAEPAPISEPSVRGAAKKPRKQSASSTERAGAASAPQEDAEGLGLKAEGLS